ncbi:MAG: hypothetical protein ABJF10_15575 [Chthoniobacter sp.]|uniref:hypothetical protein n=1 Tax=Chthoniobacter sp. TaxID=2510640 RepID=UPI0032A28583
MRLSPPLAAALALLVLAAWPAPASAQVIVRGQGGGVLILGGDGNPQLVKAEPDPAGPHLIEFFDGRFLHGTLEAVDWARHEVTWRRTDASMPLTIPMLQISRLSFVPLPAPPNVGELEVIVPGVPPPVPDPKENKTHATVKFVGGDWLAAGVANIQDNKIHLQLSDGSPLTVDRAQVDWIYFSKNAAPECYDGPTSFAGWIGPGWTYRAGALRASSPAKIERNFASLPDQVEYAFEIDQGNLMCAFNLNLHGRVGQGWSGEPGLIQCMLRASTLTLYSNSEGRSKNEQVDLTKIFGDSLDGRGKAGKSNPVRMRIFEDFTGGRLAIFINDRKAGEWNIQKGEPGKNRGGFIFQPTIWNSSSEQTLSKIRVVPWDGHVPADAEKGEVEAGDRLALTDGTARDGKFIDLVSGTARLRTEGTTFETPRDQVKMLRFSHQDGAATALPEVVARVRLVQGGEFDAAGLGWRDGKLLIQARFGSEFPMPVSAISELSFLQTPPALSTAEDVLVFENGDRLKGKLEFAEENQKVRWRTDEAAKPVEFEPAHVAGVRGGWSDSARKGRIDSVVRFRNGDWLAGRFLTLDKDQVVLETPDAGQLTISRALVRTLYFSTDGTLPISDGAADDREWLRGPDFLNQAPATTRKTPANAAIPWKSFDGAFSLLAAGGSDGMITQTGGAHIGRQIASLPALVEVSFDVTAQRGQILFSTQLFTEAGAPGYSLQMHSQGLYIYDLNPGSRARGGLIQQQVQFEGKVKPNAQQRHVQLLANRDTGQLTVLVDGVVITRFGGKPGAPPRQLGRGFVITPQVNLPCTFSNIWVGPWNGRIPGKTPQSDATQDTAILNNGDEAPGTVEVATPTVVKLTSEVGPLELPLDRVTMIDFGGAPVERTLGARLHLPGAGSLTVGSYHVENDLITCRSDMVGELRLPLHSVQELVFTVAKPPAQE